MNAYIDAGVKIRYLSLEDFSLMVVDSSECKITLKSQDYKPNQYNIHILDTSLAKAMNSYFLDLWDDALPIHSIKQVHAKDEKKGG